MNRQWKRIFDKRKSFVAFQSAGGDDVSWAAFEQYLAERRRAQRADREKQRRAAREERDVMPNMNKTWIQIFGKNRAFRVRQRRGDQVTWADFDEDYTHERTAAARRGRQRRTVRRPRMTAEQRRNRRRTPAERAAVESSRRVPRMLTPFLDRMPCRASAQPLAGNLAVFECFMRAQNRRGATTGRGRVATWGRAGVLPPVDGVVPQQPTRAQRRAFAALTAQNVTCFDDLEEAHPINVFEQRDVCRHCGAERFRTMRPGQCCEHKKLLLDESWRMPAELQNLISVRPALSKQSRAANDLFRFAQFALPKGTHRIPDSYQHLNVTGIPYAIVPNLNERSSTRSFIDDPYDRLEERERFAREVQPSDAALATIDTVLRSENQLVRQLINWAEVPQATARLVLKWPGMTSAVRAITADPAASIRQPRTIFVTKRDEDEPCYVQSTSAEYAPMMWPLAFPSGEAPVLQNGRLLDGPTATCNMQQATLAILLQPERTSDGGYLTAMTPSPYGPGHPDVPRRFSRFELMGRLGDEFILDRWLSVMDKRLRMLASEWAQRRMIGRFTDDADERDDGPDVDSEETRATYLPPDVIGSPRSMLEHCGDAMATVRQLGRQYLLFLTFTTDIKDWVEITSHTLPQGLPEELAHLRGVAFERVADTASTSELTALRLHYAAATRRGSRDADIVHGFFGWRDRRQHLNIALATTRQRVHARRAAAEVQPTDAPAAVTSAPPPRTEETRPSSISAASHEAGPSTPPTQQVAQGGGGPSASVAAPLPSAASDATFDADLDALVAVMQEESVDERLDRQMPFMRWDGERELAPARAREWRLLQAAEAVLSARSANAAAADAPGRTLGAAKRKLLAWFEAQHP